MTSAEEKTRAAERQIAIVRLFAVLTNSFVFLFLMDHGRTVTWLASVVVAVALVYSLGVLWGEPSRRHPLLLSSTFTSIGDAVLIMAWLYATGGTSSPFYLLLYLSVTAVAFRYGYLQTAFAAVLYSGSYLVLFLALGASGVTAADVVVRVAYVAMFALLAARMSRQLAEHMRSRIEIAERLKRETENAERRSRFLAEASAVLGASLEWDEIPGCVARLVVPLLGDECAVDLVDDDGRLRRMAQASVDPKQAELPRPLREPPVTMVGAQSPVRQAMDTGKMVFGPKSSVTIPLRNRGRALGAVTFGMAGSGRSHRPDDLALAAELTHRAALAIDNAYLYKQARQAIGARDAFLSVASHELRTPLTTLGLNAQRLSRLIARDGAHTTLEEVAKGTNRMAEQTQRLAHMVAQLLDVSRIDGDHLDLDLQDVDLKGVVTEAVECFDEECRRTGTVISVDVEEQAVTGRWDPLRLDQIVTNLVGNAVKFGAGRPVQVVLTAAGDRARLVVQDQGIGIAPGQQPRIFQRFERAVRREGPGGLGLGLWITRRLVESMGGSITVESELGRGARFVVDLPRDVENQCATADREPLFARPRSTPPMGPKN